MYVYNRTGPDSDQNSSYKRLADLHICNSYIYIFTIGRYYQYYLATGILVKNGCQLGLAVSFTLLNLQLLYDFCAVTVSQRWQ